MLLPALDGLEALGGVGCGKIIDIKLEIVSDVIDASDVPLHVSQFPELRSYVFDLPRKGRRG